jgi:hypothetical protein
MSDFNGQELASGSLLQPTRGPVGEIPAQQLVSSGMGHEAGPVELNSPFVGAAQLVPSDMGLTSGPSAGIPAQQLVAAGMGRESGSIGYSISAVLSGGAALEGTLGISIDASLVGGSNLTETLGYIHQVSAVLTGEATVSGELGVNYTILSSLSGEGTQDTNLTLTYAIDATMAGSSGLVSDIVLLFFLNETLSGASTVTADVILHSKLGFSFYFGASNIFEPEISITSFSWPFANLFAGSELTANGMLALFANSTMTGEGDLFVPVLYDQYTLGTALAAGGDTFFADAALKLAVDSSMPAGGSVLADLLVTMLVASTMSGAAQMDSTLLVALAPDATLAGEASLVAPNLVDNVEAALTGGATLTGEAVRTLYVEALLEGQADFAATTLLWTSHPFHPIPFPAFNNAYFLQQFIHALGVDRGLVKTAIAGNLMVVSGTRSTVVALSNSETNPFNTNRYPYYPYYYSNRFGG